jgi:hypothetical protein
MRNAVTRAENCKTVAGCRPANADFAKSIGAEIFFILPPGLAGGRSADNASCRDSHKNSISELAGAVLRCAAGPESALCLLSGDDSGRFWSISTSVTPISLQGFTCVSD